MPNISEFNAGPLGLQPSEVGVESTARAGYRLGAYGNQIAQAKDREGQLFAQSAREVGSAVREAGDTAVQYLGHREISTAAPLGAKLIDDLNNDYTKTINNVPVGQSALTDGPTVQKWREDTLEPALQKFKDGFSTEIGQQWAEHFVDTYREHMFVKSAADMSSRAKDAVAVNHQQTLNTLSNSVYNDPSSLDFAKGALSHATAGFLNSSPNISVAEHAQATTELTLKGEEQLVKSAVMGAIAKGGDWQRIANDPKNSAYINAAEIAQFAKAARTQDRVDQAAQKQIDVANKQLADFNVDKAATKTISTNVTFDAQTGRPTIDPQFFKDTLDMLRQYPDAPKGAATVRSMLDWGEMQQNGKAANIDDPATKSALSAALTDPNVPLSDTRVKILKAEVDKKITPSTGNAMREMTNEIESGPIKDPIYRSTMENAAKKLGGDTVGKQRAADFAMQFLTQYLQAGRNGTRQADALNLNDPNSMISKLLAPYMRTPTQMMMDSYAHGDTTDLNLTGPGKSITGISTFSPPPSWQYSASRKQFRDPATGKNYGLDGKEAH
jgi:hypothetical protein